MACVATRRRATYVVRSVRIDFVLRRKHWLDAVVIERGRLPLMRLRILNHTISSLFLAVTALSTYSCADDPPASEKVEGEFGSLSQAICSAAMRCCDRGEINLMMGPYVDVDNCSERYTDRTRFSPGAAIEMPELGMPRIAMPNIGAVREAVDDKRMRIDGAALRECQEYLDALPCNEIEPEEEEDLCEIPEPPPETPCEPSKLFIGLVEEGGRCSSPGASLECQPGLVCFGNELLGVFGECVRPGIEGDPCFGEGSCEEELYCSDLDGTCQRFRAQGETCVYDDREDPAPSPDTLLVRCAFGLECDPITDTCVAPCQRGSSCTSDEECDEELELECIVGRCDRPRVVGLPCAVTDDCAEGLHCAIDPEDETRQVCQERLAAGEVCAAHDECASEFCDPTSVTCAAKVAADGACPSGLDAQCDEGSCEPELVACATNDDCPLSGLCDLTTNICSGYCVELRPVGAICTADTECASGACVVGFCRELPLASGDDCESHEQCESEFCTYDDERVCAELPLALGERCQSSDECESKVCYGAVTAPFSTCTNGLDEGEACGEIGQEPCNPKKFFCDTEASPVACAPLHEAGEPCESSIQCRGECIVRFGRSMCDATVDPTEVAICDGSDPMLSAAPGDDEEAAQ